MSVPHSAIRDQFRDQYERARHVESAGVSWPKTPSVAADSYDERESECCRLFVMDKAAGGLMQMPVLGNPKPVSGPI
jgi:hypothetical protein